MSEPVVSFIIPVRNDPMRLSMCLEAIKANELAGKSYEIVVCDNGSVDQTPDVARDAGARVFDLPDIKVSELRNRGARQAHGSILAFIDADNLIVDDWLKCVMETLENHPEAGAAGCQYECPHPGTWVQRSFDAFRHREDGVCSTRWLPAGNVAVRRDAFEAIDGFDITLETCEDVDFCGRLQESGRALLSDSRLRSIHLGDPATLRQVFKTELWHGRDNLKVSLGGGLSLSDLPSIVIPMLGLGLLGMTVAGLATAPIGGWLVSGAALSAFGGLAALRAAKMLQRGKHVSSTDAHKVFAVAFTYDLARALALVHRAGHHRKHNKK